MVFKNKYKIYYIYEIKNLINGKTYRGKREFWVYKFEDIYLDKYMGSGKYLKYAQNKYGINNFSKQILTFTEDREELNLLEIQYIACEKSIGKCEYNIGKGGEGNSFYYMSDENKRKIYDKVRRSNIGRVAWNKGKHHTEESKKRMSDSQKRRPPMNEETKKKISKSNKGKSKNLTDDMRKYLSSIRKGSKLKHTDEWNKRIGEANIGRKQSDECKKKISEKNKGKNGRKVLCVELNQIFNTITEASEKFNIEVTNISSVCRGKQKTSGGFHWKYVD